MNFCIINGEVLKKEEVDLTNLFWNEPVVLSQKIWFGYGGIPLFSENVDLLIQQLNAFNVETPKFLENKRELFRITKRMLNKNRYYRSGILNFQLLFRGNKIDYFIKSQNFEEFEFPISKQGLLVNLAESDKQSQSPLNQFSFYHSNNWTIAQRKLIDSGFQSSILLNGNGMIREGIASNIFMIKDNALITPSLDSGCFEDTIRALIIEIAYKFGLKILELSNINKQHVLEMNEVFLASEEKGIQWILGIENKRFVHRISEQINEKLNEVLKSKVN